LVSSPYTRGRGETEAISLCERATSEFGALELGESKLADLVAPLAKEIKHLSVGSMPQNIVGKDSQGREFQLSEFKGKVVLIDFWADWCPYCRQMYAQERNLVKQNADKPFAILGVNCEDVARLKQAESSGNVTWRSWSDGAGGPIATAWNVSGYPTMYLIDHRGKIRLKGTANLAGEAIDAAVQGLLEEQKRGLSFDLVEPCSAWSFLDDGKSPSDTWKNPEFDESKWKSGRGVLGYGNQDENTGLEFGPNPQQKHMTSYFRHKFEAKAADPAGKLTLGLVCDDGAVVYLNGQEVVRHNLKADAKHGDAAQQKAAADGRPTTYFTLDAKHLREGTNVLAVQVHQSDAVSSDLRFDLSLSSGAEQK
jgi:thiol-disulfide isomerase/thioredoxin